MNNLTLKNTLKTIALGLGAVTAHHYGSKWLDHRETIENNEIEEMRHLTIKEKLDTVIENQDTIIKNQDNHDLAVNILNKCKEKVWNMSSSLEAGKLDDAKAHSKAVEDCIDKVFDIFTKSSNNFKMNFNLNAYYDYLDSLSLFEESTLLHIIIYIIILLTLINLMTTLFANELIKYFDLENKHRYIKKILILRSKFQRYYFILNFSILYIIIIGALILDLVVFLY